MANSGAKPYDHLVIYLIVFVTGAAVMVIEMLGTRVIAPFYGASLYVWSSIISVTMIALALGYFSGGRLADRYAGRGLSLVIALAGLCCLLIPWLNRTILLATDPLGLRLGAFVSALVLFTPCLAFLGMVGPFAIRLATERLAGVGTSAGTIYAVSTIGSVLGTLALGFFLFPLFGSRAILTGVALGLLFLAALVGIYERRVPERGSSGVATPLVIVLSLLSLPWIQQAGSDRLSEKGFQILMDRESLYGWVRVMDEPRHDMRLLTSDASVIGASRISNGASLLNYQATISLIPRIRPEIRRALIIGQGAGHLARDLLAEYGIVTDTLELDPAVAEAAESWFGFKPPGRAVVGDGRYEIRRLQGPYDLIVHDCFTGGSEPTHLLTRETFQQLRGLLSENGVLAINYVAFFDAGRNPALASVMRTLAEVFPVQMVLRNDKDHDFNDFILLASASPVNLNASGLSPEQQQALTGRREEVLLSAGEVLTDDYNPLEHHQLRKSEQYRAMVVDWLGQDLMVR